MNKTTRKALVFVTVFCVLFSSVFIHAANVSLDDHFAVQVTSSFRIPLTAAYPDVVGTEYGGLANAATLCVYEADIPVTGKFTFADSQSPANSYHWVTGSSAFNVTLTITQGKTGEAEISYNPVVTENLVTAYNGYSAGQNSNVCRTVAFFASYPTYGQPYVNLGTYHIRYVIYVDVNLEPEEYIIVQPTITKITQAMYYPDNPDNLFGMASVIKEAIDNSVDIEYIISILQSIYNADATFFANVLTQFGIVEGNQQSIISLLDRIKAQDLAFYNDVRQYLSAKQSEASEAVQHATEVQQEASEIASEMAQTQPDISEAMGRIDDLGQTSEQFGRPLFYFLKNGPILNVLMIALAVGTISYILYGRKR